MHVTLYISLWKIFPPNYWTDAKWGLKQIKPQHRNLCKTSSCSAMAETVRRVGDFKGMRQVEAKFKVEGLHFAPTSMDR